MSMFDYDAWPVSPQVVLVGNPASSVGYSIRDFMSRNGVPYDWVDLEDVERLPAVVSPSEMDPGLLAPATVEDVATGLGMMSAPFLSEYDLTIVRAGPAGLAAAVYAASEGLRALAIEAIAPGGSGWDNLHDRELPGFHTADQRKRTRDPVPLEINLPGMFACGDVRSGSIKRCAAAIGEGSRSVALVHQRLAEVGGE